MRLAAYDAIAAWYDGMVRAGFVLEQIGKPQPTAKEESAAPGYRVVPAFLLVRCLKAVGAQNPAAYLAAVARFLIDSAAG